MENGLYRQIIGGKKGTSKQTAKKEDIKETEAKKEDVKETEPQKENQKKVEVKKEKLAQNTEEKYLAKEMKKKIEGETLKDLEDEEPSSAAEIIHNSEERIVETEKQDTASVYGRTKVNEILDRRFGMFNDRNQVKVEKTETIEKKEAQSSSICQPVIETSRKKMFLDIIIDGTCSNAIYFKCLYESFCVLAGKLMIEMRSDNRCFSINWGITIIRQNQSEWVTFEEGIFTDSIQKVLEKLRQLIFYGGSSDGYEEIDHAISKSLDKFAELADCKDYRGFILFSDSIPAGASGGTAAIADFRDRGSIDFASFFLYDFENYIPIFTWTDRENAEVVPYARIDTLEHFLNEDNQQVIKAVVDYIIVHCGMRKQVVR